MTSEGAAIEFLNRMEAAVWPAGAPKKDEWVTSSIAGYVLNVGVAYGVVERAWTNQDDDVTYIAWRQLEPPAVKIRTMRLDDEGVLWVRGKCPADSAAVEAMKAARTLDDRNPNLTIHWRNR